MAADTRDAGTNDSVSAESVIQWECVQFAFARHYRERQLSSDGDTARAWGLASTSAMHGMKLENWFAVDSAGPVATVWIGDEIGTCGLTAKVLLESLEGAEKIEMFINSCGGDSACALELFRGLQGRLNTATIHGKCYSAAVTLAMAAGKSALKSLPASWSTSRKCAGTASLPTCASLPITWTRSPATSAK